MPCSAGEPQFAARERNWRVQPTAELKSRRQAEARATSRRQDFRRIPARLLE